MQPLSIRKRLLFAVVTWALGVVLLLLAAEVVLHVAPPESLPEFTTEMHGEGSPLNPGGGAYTIDAELGYRPQLGGRLYAPTGALWNDYEPAKPEGVRRILFLGDSATRRGALVEGLRAAWGDEGLEYWNAGVEGYSTPQELNYYRRFLADADEDHVILTFHLNDFVQTPVTFMHGDEMWLVRTKVARQRVMGPLYRFSYLYRFYLGHLRDVGSSEAVEAEVERSLQGLQRLCRERGSRLTVLVLPWLLAPESWTADLQAPRRKVVAILERLGIEHRDLYDALQDALAQGVEVREHPLDPQHPGPAFGLFVGQRLKAEGFEP